jgi:F-type H+-transporting ATPase subunit a
MTGSAPEHELWFTQLLNDYLAAPANAILTFAQSIAPKAASIGPSDRPWTNYIAMDIIVALILIVVAALLRPRLSVDKPGNFQQIFESIYEFIGDQAREIIGHGSRKHVAMFCTIFLLILFSNLLGIVPTFESPTMYYFVPAGIALVSFFYYNGAGIRANGVVGHLKHFAGPIWWLAWFMFPLELISHCIRPVSLTIRLFANMLAGEQVTLGFMSLVHYVVPVVFMALHVFVALLQAFIFTVLSIVYVGEATAHEESH